MPFLPSDQGPAAQQVVERLIERYSRLPARIVAQLTIRSAMTPLLVRPQLVFRNPYIGLDPSELEHVAQHVADVALDARADVVDLARSSRCEQSQIGMDHVAHVREVARHDVCAGSDR